MPHPVKDLHGIGFDADDLENTPEADIYAYPFNWNPKRDVYKRQNSYSDLSIGYRESNLRSAAHSLRVAQTGLLFATARESIQFHAHVPA